MIYRYKQGAGEVICRQGIWSGVNLRGEAQQENYWKLQTMTPTTPLLPAQAGIHLDVSMDSRLRGGERRGSERNIGAKSVQLTCMAGSATIIAPVDIGVMVPRFANRRVAITMPAKVFSVSCRRIVWRRTTAPWCKVYFMFTSGLRVFIDNIICHIIFLFKNEAGLTTEPMNGSKKLPYLFSAPASKLMQIWKMSESSRRQPWRFVFPNVTVNADSHLATSPYLKYKKVHICSNLCIACGKVALGRTIQ